MAEQSSSAAAQAARSTVAEGAKLYRGGKIGESAGPEAQFWSFENPMSPGYAKKYGIPEENMNLNFIEVGRLRDRSVFITREAPGFGTNTGGAIEVVTKPGAVKLDYFHLP